MRSARLSGERKRLHRLTHSKPLVEAFFDRVDRQFGQQGLLPSTPLTKALAYARERRAGLQVLLTDPDVAMDTNHLERALRAMPMGRKNGLFCWTEVDARYAGIVQSLIVTCRLHGIDAYTYLVDVLQRVGQHPASRVAEFTPRLWKQHFADSRCARICTKPRPCRQERWRLTADARSVENILKRTTSLPGGAIKVKVESGWVTLSGEVTWPYERQEAIDGVRHSLGVRGVSDRFASSHRHPARVPKGHGPVRHRMLEPFEAMCAVAKSQLK